MSRAIAHVIDASAILCLLFSETGADRVTDVIGGAALSTVNYAEILSKLIERGAEPVEAVAKLEDLPFTLVPLDRASPRPPRRSGPPPAPSACRSATAAASPWRSVSAPSR